MVWKLVKTDDVYIYCSATQSEAVRIAAGNLAADIHKVLGAKAQAVCASHTCKIVIDDEWTPSGELAGRKEAYTLNVRDGALHIAGADRRGIIYGIYHLCAWMGVSPWYFFADVPVKKKECLTLPEGYYFSDYPSVEYRGVFINDEEELEKWVKGHMGEETIGVKTYEKIFELLLRMGANYIWPAMHVNSFNVKRENGELADRMGIVVGTSHCDMLMRSNNREWFPWIVKKGYTDALYDYSIEGKNREILDEYWRESVCQNRDFEVGYTLGMRGIHDSGFETRAFDGLEGDELLQAKINLLQTVIDVQEKILADELKEEPLKSFVPYKEVLVLYDNGLKVPEDITLIWTNDNYGYIRRYPDENEKKRKGGNGIYYHGSYWGHPAASYLFINSIPLAQTRNELYKAWCEGIRKVWVLNVGAIKPLEQDISFYLRFAWEVGKENALTDDVNAFLKEWIDASFSGGHGGEMAEVLCEFAQLTNARKLEFMNSDIFSQTAYGDEATVRINRYKKLVDRADRVYDALPKEERAAFFQMCLMKIHAAYYTNCMYYYADRSNLAVSQGKDMAARKYADASRFYDDCRRRMLIYYNDVMLSGKWSGILTPEDYPPPRTAMYPACVVPLEPEDRVEERLVLTLWNDEKDIVFVKDREKWFELANTSGDGLEYVVDAPEWVRLYGGGIVKEYGEGAIKECGGACRNIYRGKVSGESRILVRCDGGVRGEDAGNGNIDGGNIGSGSVDGRNVGKWNVEGRNVEGGNIGSRSRTEGVITVICEKTGQKLCVKVKADFAECDVASEREMSAISTDACMTDKADCAVGRNDAGLSACAIADGGIVMLEAEKAKELCSTEASENLGNDSWKIIEHLGYDHGNLIEAETDGTEPLTYDFILTRDAKEPLLEIFRFPSLNSVGHIRAEVSVDGGEYIAAESEATDEWRGAWRENSLNGVEKLAVRLSQMKAGRHTLKLRAVDKYFAFSRIAIYTDKRKDNMLGAIDGNSELPNIYEVSAAGQGLYGDILLAPRDMLVSSLDITRDTIVDKDIRVAQDEYGGKVTPQDILAMAEQVFVEKDGTIRIDAAAALAETENAYTAYLTGDEPAAGAAGDASAVYTAGKWNYCLSESYARTGLAMQVRKPGIRYENGKEPSLHYRICCDGGEYRLWLLMKCDNIGNAEVGAGIDGVRLDAGQINMGMPIGRYSGEYSYRWIPMWKQELTAGVHTISLYMPSSGCRFDRIYMTKGDELPPVDAMWR